MPYPLIVLNVILMSLGQLLFKKAALFMKDGGSLFERYAYNKWLWVAVVVYGVATLLWVYILGTVKLNIAYPIMIGSSYFLTLIGAYFFFGETLGVLGVMGILFICIGVVFVSV
jgi:multidrug transporter EmrE-like cation transporter